MGVVRIVLIMVIAALPCLAPYNTALARCPVPFLASPAVIALAHREGSGKPNTIPTRNHNPCALGGDGHYLRFPSTESGFRRCQELFLSMSESAIMRAWMLAGKTDRGSMTVARLIHKEKRTQTKCQ